MRLLYTLMLLLALTGAGWSDPIQPSEPSPYGDRRASRVGDAVTLLIRDVTNVVQRLDDRSDGGTQVSVPTLGYLLSGFFLLPSLNTGSNSGTRVQESLSHRFESTLTCRVVEVLENGDLRVEGRRHVTLNGDQQSLTLRGVVRPNDLGPENTCESSRLADLEIDYQGPLTGKARAGLLRSILEILF